MSTPIPIPSPAALLQQALAQLYPHGDVIVNNARPVPALQRRAWAITVQRTDSRAASQHQFLALFLPFIRDETDPAARYERAAQHGLPAPTVLARAEDGTQVVLLCAPPVGDSIANSLQQARAPWEVSAAAVSVARFLDRLHGCSPVDLGIASTSLQDSTEAEQRIDQLRAAAEGFPVPVRSIVDRILDWIDEQLLPDGPQVPTLNPPRLAALFAASGEIAYVLGWDQLAVRPPADDIAGLLSELQSFEPALREQFLSVTIAAYLQRRDTSLQDVPARALLAHLERTMTAASARASRANEPDGTEQDEGMATALLRAFRAAQSGLVALARHDLTP